MKYINAQNILPEELIQHIQEYIHGDYIYIPRKIGEQKKWGENSGAKYELTIRNREIYQKYMEGSTVTALSEQYYLSEQSIRRIVHEEKSKTKQKRS
ncbi:hypothetical protein H0486_03855 [Lachnospiraceae bacterium MD1]|jgi:Mor family transcriptional regulator|uniref:Mor transcription activator domain-containing protein n=1 Tax=Variimorphobacter saccharofermentans TaxID=2755051 RepID=A0A839JZC6_9FIRM|nr:CD3324 family protein [Variimorphobacter saccharofermentans]MBB2182009.1 hypothetical protein [Variimorphobacter saccharofermentans]